MSIALWLDSPHGHTWQHTESGSVWAKGYVYSDRGLCLTGQELVAYFAHARTESEFTERLRRANGCFAVIWRKEDFMIAAVDRIRSYPLLYQVDEAQLILTDHLGGNGQEIREPDEAQIAFWPYTAHTLGHYTLSHHWRQLQAGEYLLMSQKRTQRHSYHQLYNRAMSSQPKSLQSVAESTFERLLSGLQGHRPVVPLSGGYDSRFIAAMLKHVGASEVICYTYGRPDSYEVQISQQVAQQLGYEWHFVPYHQDKLAPYLSDEGMAYQDWAAAGNSVAHEQDWTAVRVLKAEGKLPENAAFLPGFGGDVLAGSWFPQGDSPSVWNQETLGQYLLDQTKFFSGERVPQLNRPILETLISEEIGHIQVNDLHSAFDALQYWGLRNRMSKLLVNAVRGYEFFGYTWRLPFFDLEWMDFWLGQHDATKLNKALYLDTARKWLFQPMGIDFEQPKLGNTPLRLLVKRYLKPQHIDWLKARLLPRRAFDLNNDLDLAGLFCAHHGWSPRLPQSYSLNYLMACSYLQRHVPGYRLPFSDQ